MKKIKVWLSNRKSRSRSQKKGKHRFVWRLMANDKAINWLSRLQPCLPELWANKALSSFNGNLLDQTRRKWKFIGFRPVKGQTIKVKILSTLRERTPCGDERCKCPWPTRSAETKNISGQEWKELQQLVGKIPFQGEIWPPSCSTILEYSCENSVFCQHYWKTEKSEKN